MSMFFNKEILNELGVKGGRTLEDEENNNQDTNDGPQDPPEDDDSTEDGPQDPPEDDDSTEDGPQDPPEDDDSTNDGPQDPPEDDDSTEDGPQDPPEDDDSTEDGPQDPPEDTNEIPDDGPQDPPEDTNEIPDDDDSTDDGPQDPPEDDDSTEDGDMDDFDDSKEQTLSDIEDSIFSSLTPEQKGIKVAELKGSFVEVYKASDDIIEKINLIPKDNSNIEVFERLVNTLIDLKTYVEYYISKTFDTKSYLENEVVLQKYTTILNQVKEVFKETSKRK